MGKVVAIRNRLFYSEAKTKEEQEVIIDFKRPYYIIRINLMMEDLDKIDQDLSESKTAYLWRKSEVNLRLYFDSSAPWKNLLRDVLQKERFPRLKIFGYIKENGISNFAYIIKVI